MSGTVEDVIRVAKSQLGETDGAKYFAAFDTPDLGAWCVAFVRWCMKQACVEFPWHTWYAWDYNDAPNPIAPRDLQAGDAVSFDWDDDSAGDHVGIVVSVHSWGIKTIEGNTSGGIVAEREREWPSIVCGIRPTYAERKAQWIKQDGRWWYRHADGSYTRNGWEKINGRWYYFDCEGWMLASTVVNDGTGWYALGESGAMLTDVQTNPEHDGTYGRLIL